MRNDEIRPAARWLLLAGSAAIAWIGSAATAAAQSGDFRPGWWLELEGRAASLLGSHQPWTASPTTDSVLTARVASAWGGRITGGYRMSPTWDFALAYTGMQGHKKSADVAATDHVFGILAPYKTSWHSGHLKLDNSLHMGDFEAGYNVGLGSGRVRLIGGLRLIHWQQDTRVDYTYPGYTSHDEKRARYTGLGPRIAVQGQWPVMQLGNGALSIQGLFGVGAVFGQYHNRWKSYATYTGGAVDATSERDTRRVVYSLEGMMAASYEVNMAGVDVALALGYRVDALMRINDTSTSAGDPALSSATSLNTAIFGRQNGSVMYHGPVARVTLRF